VAIIAKLGLTGFKCYTSPHQIVFTPTGQKIVFRGFNNPTSLASIKFEAGMLTDVYIEEASEIPTYEDFRVLDGSLRGIMPPGVQMQITMALNPWNKEHWIYDVFVKGRMEDDVQYMETHDYREGYWGDFTLGYGRGLYLHQSTYRINEFRDKALDADAELMKARMPEIYYVEKLGMWGNSTQIVYPEWSDGLIKPRSELMRMEYDGYAIGIDTGYSDGQGSIRRDGTIKSATVAVLVGLTQGGKQLIALDEWFFSNQTAGREKTVPEIMSSCAQAILEWRERTYYDSFQLMKGIIPIYVDSADIGFRQGFELECRKDGLMNVSLQGSTKIAIQSRVDFERVLFGWGDCLVSDRCKNLVRELKSARRGEKGVAREDANDHATNAFEYAWTPLRDRMLRWKTFKSHV
jgi:PBSX family phage terminase large subunit